MIILGMYPDTQKLFCRMADQRQTIEVQKTELAAADWHDLNTAENFPIFQKGPMFKSIWACCKAYAAGTYTGIKGKKLENGFNPNLDLLIHSCATANF